WTFDDGFSATGEAVSHAFTTAGQHTGTVTVTDPTGLKATSTATVTVISPAPAPNGSTAPVDRVAPVVTGLRLKPAQFVSGHRATAVSGGDHRGTTISFRLSETASVSLRFERVLTGRRSHGACDPPSRRLRRASRCERYVIAGALARHGIAGSDHVLFSGRI